MSTRIAQRLSELEKTDIADELRQSNLVWGPHYLLKKIEGAPLRHGKTIYVKSINVLTHEIIVDNSQLFKKTIEILTRITGHNTQDLARSYWHKLEPNDRIDIHKDIDEGGTSYFKKITRYLLFLDMKEGFIAILNQQLWNYSEERLLSRVLLEFDPSDWHFFFNASESDIKFLVADFYFR